MSPNASPRPRPILVTGSHRSGTTWVGRMVAASPEVGYILEPFHVKHRPGICRALFPCWFTHVCKENESLYRDAMVDCLQFKYQLGQDLRSMWHPHHLIALLKNYPAFRLHRRKHHRPLMKDPIAFFSAEWLADTLDMQVIIMIRHPAAFAGSLKEANWTFDFKNFLAQPTLMRDYLSGFHEQMERMVERHDDIIDQAIMLWNAIHQTALFYRRKHPDWLFIRHEDLAAEPVEGFRSIFEYLALDYNEQIKRQIICSSNRSNPTKQRSVNDTMRDSRSLIRNWQRRLTADEVDRVRQGCAEIWPQFYSNEDWQ